MESLNFIEKKQVDSLLQRFQNVDVLKEVTEEARKGKLMVIQVKEFV